MRIQQANVSSVSSAIHSFDKPAVVAKQNSNEINVYDGFRIEIANTIPQLMDAANLAYHGYLKKGFVSSSDLPFVFNEWDVSGLSVCLVAYDMDGNCVGTNTVVPDFKNLPVDLTFNEELNTLRDNEHNLCEFTRLVIHEDFRNQKTLLIALYEWASLITEFYFHGTDIIIEVNPRHQTFYAKKLLFEVETAVKNCPLVNDAPAVLLRLPIHTCKKFREEGLVEKSTKRLMYKDFSSHEPRELKKMLHFLLKESKKIESQLSLTAYLKSFEDVKVG